MKIEIDGQVYTADMFEGSFARETVEIERAPVFDTSSQITLEMTTEGQDSIAQFIADMAEAARGRPQIRGFFTYRGRVSPNFVAWTLSGLVRKGRKWMHAIRREEKSHG